MTGVLVMTLVPVTAVRSGAGPASVVVMPGGRVMGVVVGAYVVQGSGGRLVLVATLVSVVVFVVDRHVDHLQCRTYTPWGYTASAGLPADASGWHRPAVAHIPRLATRRHRRVSHQKKSAAVTSPCRRVNDVAAAGPGRIHRRPDRRLDREDASCGIASGVIMTVTGYSTLSIIGTILVIAIIPFVAASPRRRRTSSAEEQQSSRT
ncbi:hypothetical protein [Actinoplanes sp. NPDC049802]|uniref:hypothetical protein n=1 Tax=Actinoplanes sp. NPDC049802 TaxID=3154742 RepID=UPI0034033237